MDDFKFIYWMEFAHRYWGRLLGIAFLGPALLFYSKGWLNKQLIRRLGLLFALGGGQGLVGWWMVKSGLEAPKSEFEIPKVSPYRLAAHLSSAFIIYVTLLWTTLSVATPSASTSLPIAQIVGSNVLMKWIVPVTGLIAVTACSGAFVAGLDAGHAYNSFPLMNGHIVPEEYWAIQGWRNSFENTAAVQFHHRVLAVGTLVAVLAMCNRFYSASLPKSSQMLLKGLTATTMAQVGLGVATLLNHVPPSFGAAHQGTALLLVTLAVGLLHNIQPIHQGQFPWLRLVAPAVTAALILLTIPQLQSALPYKL